MSISKFSFAILFANGLLLFCLNSQSQDLDQADTLTLPPEAPAAEANQIKSGSTKLENKLDSKADMKKELKAKENVGAVLDFEGEVIEGERRRPDLFLQISIDNVKFDSLIYNRDDFNDYLETDRKTRNRFFKLK